jgi:hypothetical protein
MLRPQEIKEIGAALRLCLSHFLVLVPRNEYMSINTPDSETNKHVLANTL